MEKNINEEIKRIKTLFTEERLYGNLVEATNPDSDLDGIINATEFTASGNEIDRVEAEMFLTSSSKPNDDLLSYCMRPGSTLKEPKEYIWAGISGETTLHTKMSSSATNCFWEIRNPKTAYATKPQVSMMYILEKFKMGFFVKLTPAINLSTAATVLETLEFQTPNLKAIVRLNEARGNEQKITYLKFVGELNSSQFAAPTPYSNIEYRNLKFTGFYDDKYKLLPKGIEQPLFKTLEDSNSSAGYRPLVSGVRNDDYSPRVDGIIEGLDISPVSGNIQSIIDNLKIS